MKPFIVPALFVVLAVGARAAEPSAALTITVPDDPPAAGSSLFRHYTLDEIKRMRTAILRSVYSEEEFQSIDEDTRDHILMLVENVLRTYIEAGVTPAELEANP